VFENRALRGLFRKKVIGTGEYSIIQNFIYCTPHEILFGWSNEGE
jgi:hypothetical protein